MLKLWQYENLNLQNYFKIMVINCNEICFLYEYRVKCSCAPTLLATHCTIAPFEVCPTTTNKFLSVILESDYIDYHGYGYNPCNGPGIYWKWNDKVN
jgi:hypothetical protein